MVSHSNEQESKSQKGRQRERERECGLNWRGKNELVHRTHSRILSEHNELNRRTYSYGCRSGPASDQTIDSILQHSTQCPVINVNVNMYEFENTPVPFTVPKSFSLSLSPLLMLWSFRGPKTEYTTESNEAMLSRAHTCFIDVHTTHNA